MTGYESCQTPIWVGFSPRSFPEPRTRGLWVRGERIEPRHSGPAAELTLAPAVPKFRQHWSRLPSGRLAGAPAGPLGWRTFDDHITDGKSWSDQRRGGVTGETGSSDLV